MAVQDKNYLVRATALECLQEMAKVEEFWTAIDSNNNIYVSVFNRINHVKLSLLPVIDFFLIMTFNSHSRSLLRATVEMSNQRKDIVC